MKYLIYFAILIILASCSNDKKPEFIDVNGAQMLACDILNVKDTIDFPLSELIEDCEMVRLKADEGSLFDKAWHTSISDNYIAIKSYGKFPVKLFKKDGTFIRDLGSIGRGPGEYTSLYGIQLDEERNRIYLTPFANAQNLIVYSLDGQYLEDIPLAFRSGKIRAFVEGDKVSVVCMPIGNGKVAAFQQTLDGTIISQVPAAEYLFSASFDNEVFSFNNSSNIEFHNTVVDTLYEYSTTDNKLIPKFHLRTPPDQKIRSLLYSLPDHYYAWVVKKGRLLVDKKSGESHYIKLKNDFMGSFEVDIWGGLNGMYINVIPAIILKEKIAEALKDKNLSDQDKTKLVKIDKDTHEEDSPIVFFGKFKN